MTQRIGHVALLVREYEEAIDFFVGTLGFELLHDDFMPEQNKRWVTVAPPGGNGSALLLARAANDEQARFVGNQSGGRVFLFLETDDFRRDYEALKGKGVEFVREPLEAPFGTVAVFKDLYGNLWDLIQPKA